ncbi:MAG: pyridoxamine kinase [Lachnospiraceae bacterium]|nr:pyridoxamine kinase [Lachnospiraceae bacterium]
MNSSEHNHQKKIAVINDFSGFGRCSLAVSLPIISTMKIQCCPLPTSVFSNHTGFDSFYFRDFTDYMNPYIEEWRKLGLRFNGITSGFLGSKQQIDIVKAFIKEFQMKDTIVLVDPVMGDNGVPYATYTKDMCQEMKKLVSYADILTPNLTEACILTDTEYRQNGWKMAEIQELAQKLQSMGPGKIVITGIIQGEFIANYCYDAKEYEKDTGYKGKFMRTHKIGSTRSGTGDIFAAIVAADAVNGVPFEASVRKASGFIKKCIQKSIDLDIPLTDGVCFEEVLSELRVR